MSKLHRWVLFVGVLAFFYVAFFRHQIQPNMPKDKATGDLATCFVITLAIAFLAGKRFAEGRPGEIGNLVEGRPFKVLRLISDSHHQGPVYAVLLVDGREKIYPYFSSDFVSSNITHLRVVQSDSGPVFDPLWISRVDD